MPIEFVRLYSDFLEIKDDASIDYPDIYKDLSDIVDGICYDEKFDLYDFELFIDGKIKKTDADFANDCMLFVNHSISYLSYRRRRNE